MVCPKGVDGRQDLCGGLLDFGADHIDAGLKGLDQLPKGVHLGGQALGRAVKRRRRLLQVEMGGQHVFLNRLVQGLGGLGFRVEHLLQRLAALLQRDDAVAHADHRSVQRMHRVAMFGGGGRKLVLDRRGKGADRIGKGADGQSGLGSQGRDLFQRQGEFRMQIIHSLIKRLGVDVELRHGPVKGLVGGQDVVLERFV